jgi:hypothetical protein
MSDNDDTISYNYNESDTDDVDQYQNTKYNNVNLEQKYKYNTENEIPTEGIDNCNSLKECNPSIKIFECEACDKVYGGLMKIELDEILFCAHCFYSMNYGNKEIIVFSTISIDQYIFTCSSSHQSPCPKLKDSGGCYLCMANMGMNIDDVNELVFGYEKLPVKKNEIYDDTEIIVVEKEKTDSEINTMLSHPLLL